MRVHDLEAWVLEIADRVRSNQPVEDSRVELKAEWPTDHARAARRLAGHCNAAHGEPVLWVIGIDEGKGVVGASREPLPDWLSQVHKHFESLAPELIRDLNVPVDDKTVVALLFNTDRAPYVVKNPLYGQSGMGPIQREVPWRDGTRVRSARREDLIRLLAPIQRLPTVEVLSATLSCERVFQNAPSERGYFSWKFHAELYVALLSPGRLILPYHRYDARFSVEPLVPETTLHVTDLTPVTRRRRHTTWRAGPEDGKESLTVATEVAIKDAGMISVSAEHRDDDVVDGVSTRCARFSLTLCPAGMDQRLTLGGELAPSSEGGSPRWTLTAQEKD